MQSIRPSQWGDWLQQLATEQPGVKPVLLDVREPWECQTASVKADDGFTLVQMPMRTVPARYMEMDRDLPIACLCHHGARSAQVVHFLMQQGFSHVVNVHGGINAWSHERDPGVPTY
ncbi:rhodanese-like domain-containing protein [Hydrogenophaga sp.]|uniref:rhodanese-like domain-containing protein n=1 Tax=Hydrogenophaga sp. TaxID=1904254 RepID=UPI00286E9BD9|nr:rhodanese-like domain-containing protein [Hydrogenophaga sp.]